MRLSDLKIWRQSLQPLFINHHDVIKVLYFTLDYWCFREIRAPAIRSCDGETDDEQTLDREYERGCQ